MFKTLAATILAATAVAGAAAQAGDKPSLVTILTETEPQTQLMSFVLTMQSMQQGAKVHVLLCGPAGDVALKDAPPYVTAPQKPAGMSTQAVMQKLIAGGGTVQVCATYLPNKGVGTEALIDGVTAANPADMGARLVADNTRIMSF